MNSSQYASGGIETKDRLADTGQRKSASAAGTKESTMKAIVNHNYGSPDVLKLEEVQKPTPLDSNMI